jgi:hypothetical protein
MGRRDTEGYNAMIFSHPTRLFIKKKSNKKKLYLPTQNTGKEDFVKKKSKKEALQEQKKPLLLQSQPANQTRLIQKGKKKFTIAPLQLKLSHLQESSEPNHDSSH